MVSQEPQGAASPISPPCPSWSVTQRATAVMLLAMTTLTGCPLARHYLKRWFPLLGTCWRLTSAGGWSQCFIIKKLTKTVFLTVGAKLV